MSQLPETIVLTPSDVTVSARMRKVDTRELPLRALARQAFDVLRVERVADAPQELGDAVDRLRENVDELERVFTFALDSAIGELGLGAGQDAGAATERRDVPDALEHAPRLVSDALQNIADTLRAEVAEVEQAFETTGTKLYHELSTGALGLIERIAAGGVQAQMLAAQSGLVELRAWAAERWGPYLSQLDKAGRYWVLQLQRAARRWLRVGRRALSGSLTEEVASTRMVRLLAEARKMMRTLPPVYQRLFTLDPIAEPSLLVGRDAVLADTTARWRRLEQGEADCVVFGALPGAGLTSFLHALERLVSDEGGRVARVAPSDRILEEDVWAAVLSEALELDPCSSLDDLAETILESEPDALPGLVTLDNMEHLFLRAPDGMELMEATLTLMARTEGESAGWAGSPSPRGSRSRRCSRPQRG